MTSVNFRRMMRSGFSAGGTLTCRQSLARFIADHQIGCAESVPQFEQIQCDFVPDYSHSGCAQLFAKENPNGSLAFMCTCASLRSYCLTMCS
jgi:hypothetical protein